jgi:hypothetical protein
MSLFDAPDREYSVAYREVGITPLQPLALLNDPQFIEAARRLSITVLEEVAVTETEGTETEAEATPTDQVQAAIAVAFAKLTARKPNEVELDMLGKLYVSQLAAATTANPALVEADLRVAALTQVVRVLFNLNETITQE